MASPVREAGHGAIACRYGYILDGAIRPLATAARPRAGAPQGVSHQAGYTDVVSPRGFGGWRSLTSSWAGDGMAKSFSRSTPADTPLALIAARVPKEAQRPDRKNDERSTRNMS
jgi:hypothetical protein